MNYKILNKKNYKLTTWSGGDTNELYIYPETSEYIKRNFLFRISSANVKDEKSSFTKLEGVSRKLMPLNGKLKLCFENKYEKELDKFEIESFSGDWNTTSYGKATDFNLMTKSGCSGELEHISVLNKHSNLIKIENRNLKNHIECIYNLGEEVNIYFENEIVTLKNKEILVLELKAWKTKMLLKIVNGTKKDIDIIRTIVYYD